MHSSQTIEIQSQSDVEHARREARLLAASAGFDAADAEMVAISVSELATNLHRYARQGRIVLRRIDGNGKTGIEIESRDNGPGIADIDRAMQDGYSTGGGMGSGLPAVKRLMDEFAIESRPEGTTVTARKWATNPTT